MFIGTVHLYYNIFGARITIQDKIPDTIPALVSQPQMYSTFTPRTGSRPEPHVVYIKYHSTRMANRSSLIVQAQGSHVGYQRSSPGDTACNLREGCVTANSHAV